MILLTWLLACAGPSSIDMPTDTGADLTVEVSPLSAEVFTQKSNSEGRMRVPVEITEGTISMMVTGTTTEAHSLYVDEVISPTGTVMLAEEWREQNNLTQAVWARGKATQINWPIRSIDPQLTPGEWIFWLTTVNEFYSPDDKKEVEITVHRKTDEDLLTGVLKVHVVYSKGLLEMPKVTNAVDSAIERWQELYLRHGITVEVASTSDSKLDPMAPHHLGNDPKVMGVAADIKGPDEIMLVISEGFEDVPNLFGKAGGIPGTLVPTEQTWITVGWLLHAGQDAKFDKDEYRQMGETMSHEAGHYLGLFHPVEMDFTMWDALADTTECGDAFTCEADLGKNMMFPYPLCDWEGCEPATKVTTEQKEVAHRYVGLL
jgi:hypothetical protein